MGFLKSVWEQLLGVWTRSSNSGKLALVGLIALSIFAVAGVGVWSSRPQYVTLAASLAPSAAAEIAAALDERGIPFKVNVVGSAVLVPKADWSRARMAVADLIGPTVEESPDDAMAPWISDPDDRHARLVRAKEAKLEQTIGQMKAISSVDVRIAQPKWSPFPTRQSPSKASVTIGVRPSAIFTRQHAATIASLVASSVEGLNPDGVTVVGLDGQIYAQQGSQAEADYHNRFEFRNRVEAELSARAETMLASMLGPGKALVRVTADIDFTRSETEETTFSPNAQKKTEKIVNETTKASPLPAGSAPGAPPAGGNSSAGTSPGSSVSKEEVDTEYYRDQKNLKTVIAPGAIKRMSIAATIDLSTTAPTTGAPAAPDPAGPAAPVYTLAQIENLIKNAVGFDDARGDTITVLDAPLADPGIVPPEEIRQIETMELMTEVARNSSLGIGAVVALIIAMWVLKKMKPITLSPEPMTGSSAQRSRTLVELQQQIAQNPETVAKILAAWLNEPGGANNDQNQTPTARAA